MLKVNFGYKEYQERATYGLGYKLTLTMMVDEAVLIKSNKTNIGKIKISAIDLSVPHYTPSISNKTILSKQILTKTPRKLQYVEGSVFMKEKNTQNLWTSELGTQDGINILIWVLVGFQKGDRQNSQNFNNDTFHRPPVTSAQCIIGFKKIPDNSIILN